MNRNLGANFDYDCPIGAEDVGVFDLSAQGTGTAGTACAGRVFNITETRPITGQHTLTPVDGLPVILAPTNNTDDLDTCRIAFTFNVLRRPAQPRRRPGVADAQTQQLASAELVANATQNPGGGIGSDTVTVLAAPVTIATVASVTTPPTTPATLRDTATISTPPNTPAPTGTLTFRLFGPNDSNCDGVQDGTGTVQPLRTSVVAAAAGPVQSGTFAPTAPGDTASS